MIKQVIGINEADRVLLAHSFLDPAEDGSVKFIRLYLPGGVLKNRMIIWTKVEFRTKITELLDLTRHLGQVKNDLSTFRIEIPNLGWLTVDSFQPRARHPSPEALRAIVAR